jgi:hypothetical protein
LFDNGTALATQGLPQNEALNWLFRNKDLDIFSNEQKIQRYSLATLYYSLNGVNWIPNTKWLSDGNECDWYSRADGSKCSSDESIMTIHLKQNNLTGAIPDELMLLTSLGKFSVFDMHHLNSTISLLFVPPNLLQRLCV